MQNEKHTQDVPWTQMLEMLPRVEVFREIFPEEEGKHPKMVNNAGNGVEMGMSPACLWDGTQMVMVTLELSWDWRCLLG